MARVVREKYGGQLSKIEAGEEGYEDLFIFACPKFIHPAVPDYSQASAPGAAATKQQSLGWLLVLLVFPLVPGWSEHSCLWSVYAKLAHAGFDAHSASHWVWL